MNVNIKSEFVSDILRQEISDMVYRQFIIAFPHPYNKIGDGPEGPETAKVADSLRRGMENKVLMSINLLEEAKHEGLDEIVLPKKIVRVESRGKKILFTLEDGVIIANELKMTGSWSKTSTKHSKFSFILDTGEEFFFICIRKWAKTYVLFTQKQKDAYFLRVGPDILRNVIPKEEWAERYRRMTKKRKGSKPYLICDALLEQPIFSGIGNYLRADILYQAKIRPDKPTQELTDDEYERLRLAAHDLIRKSYKARGFSMRNYRDVDGTEGVYNTLVYNQEMCPLGHKVLRSRFNGKWPKRSMYWVPQVQK